MWEPYSWINVNYLSRLLTRFTLSATQYAKDAFVLIRTVQPVTQVDDLLENLDLVEEVIAGKASDFSDMTPVPTGKRWKVYAMMVERVTGDRTAEKLFIMKGTMYMQLYSWTAAATYSTGMLSSPLPVDEGWIFRVYFPAGGTADGTFAVRMLRTEADAY